MEQRFGSHKDHILSMISGWIYWLIHDRESGLMISLQSVSGTESTDVCRMCVCSELWLRMRFDANCRLWLLLCFLKYHIAFHFRQLFYLLWHLLLWATREDAALKLRLQFTTECGESMWTQRRSPRIKLKHKRYSSAICPTLKGARKKGLTLKLQTLWWFRNVTVTEQNYDIIVQIWRKLD